MISDVTLGITYGDVLHKKSLHISVNKEGVKATPAEKIFFHLPTARFYPKNETPQDEKIFILGQKESLRQKPEAKDYSMEFKKMATAFS